MLYIRQSTLEVMKNVGRQPWEFRTKLEWAAELLEWAAGWFRGWLGKRIIAVVDGAYAKRVFLSRTATARVTVISWLRRDAALFSLTAEM